MLGIVLTAAFFIISYFGTPKTSLADDDHDQNKNNVLGNTIIISEYGSKGHNGEQRDEYIELYNLTSSAINLSGYKLQYYQNNSSAKTVYLSGTIQADDYFVIAVRNGKNSNSQPTNNLSYDFLLSFFESILLTSLILLLSCFCFFPFIDFFCNLCRNLFY